MFPALSSRPLQVVFDEPDSTSDGGALLLKAADRKLGLTEALAGSLTDGRDAGRIAHSFHDLVRQRIYGLALGYEDANDAARVGDDPMHKLLLGRDPLTGEALASQPTLSRFENGVRRTELYRMGRELTQAQLRRLRARRKSRPPRRITIDLDVTDDVTHGRQQLSFFHGHYDSWCYLPLLAFVTLDDEPENYLVAAVLRSGRAHPKQGATGLLRRVIAGVHRFFPQVRVRVRLDGGFAAPEVLAFLDAEKVEYVVGLPKNDRLIERTARAQQQARDEYEEHGYPRPVFAETRYAARTWTTERRVVAKAEVTLAAGREPKDNPRFVVTNLRQRPETVYAIYCQRAEIENRLKELKGGMAMDRTSCTSFWANQLRVLLAAAAYVLLQELRTRLRGTGLARAQVERLRLALLRIGGRITRSVRRIVVHLAASHPWQPPWVRVAIALGANRV
jgi:hypothetical protein